LAHHEGDCFGYPKIDLTHFADLDMNPYSHVSYYTDLSEKYYKVTEMVEEYGH